MLIQLHTFTLIQLDTFTLKLDKVDKIYTFMYYAGSKFFFFKFQKWLIFMDNITFKNRI